MAEHLGLADIKEQVRVAGYTKIKRVAGGAPAVPLENWNGISSEVGSGYFHVGVSYELRGTTVIAHKRGEADIHYLLS
jgi:hypothetical protein